MRDTIMFLMVPYLVVFDRCLNLPALLEEPVIFESFGQQLPNSNRWEHAPEGIRQYTCLYTQLPRRELDRIALTCPSYPSNARSDRIPGNSFLGERECQGELRLSVRFRTGLGWSIARLFIKRQRQKLEMAYYT